jgi:O-antigen ligase
MYLEILSGSGLIGALAFGWLCCVIASLSLGTLRTAQSAAAAAVVAAIGAMAFHGVVDSFLTFTPTYVLFSVTAGLLAGLPGLVRDDAHRI